MNGMKRRTISMLLAAAMALGILAGCAPAGSGGTASSSAASDSANTSQFTPAAGDDNIDLSGALPIVKDPSKLPQMNIVILWDASHTKRIRETPQVKRMEEETGVIFNWNEIDYQGSAEKINLMIASDNLPDAFWNGIENSMAVQYMDQNVFLPTEELTDKYVPRLKEIYEKRPEYKAAATMPNGHAYGFPYIEEMYGLVYTPGPFLINSDWLKKVGKPMPTTVDEWVACLKAFRDAGDLNGNGVKDEWPYAVGLGSTDFLGTTNTFLQFTGAFGCASTTNGSPEDYFRVIDGKITFTAADPAYRDTANFFNMLNKEKLIDPNSFSPGPSPDQPLYINTVTDSVAHIGSFAVWEPMSYLPVKEVHDQYAPLPRLQGPKGKIGEKANFSEMQNTSMMAITTACKNPEVLAAFVNYCYTPELSVTLDWGALGYMYKKDANGILVPNVDENGELILQPGFGTVAEMEDESRPTNGPLAVLDEFYDTVCSYAYNAVEVLKFQKVNGKEDIIKEYVSVPKMLLTLDEQSTVSQIQPQIYNIVTKYTLQWILDGDADQTWNKYLADLDAAGLPKLTATFQQAYDRYTANMK